MLVAKLLHNFGLVKKNCITPLITTKLNCFAMKPSIKTGPYRIIRLPLSFFYKLS